MRVHREVLDVEIWGNMFKKQAGIWSGRVRAHFKVEPLHSLVGGLVTAGDRQIEHEAAHVCLDRHPTRVPLRSSPPCKISICSVSLTVSMPWLAIPLMTPP